MQNKALITTIALCLSLAKGVNVWAWDNLPGTSLPKLYQTNLYTKIAHNCKPVVLQNWVHPTRQVFESMGNRIRKVELCNNKIFPIFHVEMKVEISYHSLDKQTSKYVRKLLHDLIRANGGYPLAIVEVTDNKIVYMKKSTSRRGYTDLSYEEYAE
ncbi:hypothetical protein TI04_02175 [Achromatium sp. WMS2]|nr:hypothetical protein TI04_02175 [Achromatium sp. WMS2]